MSATGDRLPAVISKLRACGLIPPVKSVESVAAGVIRLTVGGAATPELRARLTAVMGSTNWVLVEGADDEATGIEHRS